MGAGVLECDVAFTKDRELVCRHAQCDLHTTTDILARPELAAKCTKGFEPADPVTGRKASAKCCTSDLTLAEFKSLRPKMDAGNPDATNVKDYMNSTPRWRTDLYVDNATLVTHKEFIALVKSLGLKFTPELKKPEVAMPFQGDYTQERYAQQMIDDYKAAGVEAKDVYPQSFELEDILYWIKADPEFGKQAVFLDDRDETDKGFDISKPESWKPGMKELADQGVKILAPPLWMLVSVGKDGSIVPSVYAEEAKKAGLGLISLVAGALRPAEGWRRLLFPVDQGHHQARRRHAGAARRAGEAGRRDRRVLRLAGDDDLLRQLRRVEVSDHYSRLSVRCPSSALCRGSRTDRAPRVVDGRHKAGHDR